MLEDKVEAAAAQARCNYLRWVRKHVAYLPRKLTTQAAPEGIDPQVGDIAYYAPWGNLAIYYRDFGYSSGLIRLGRLASGLDALTAQPSGTLTIEAVK